MGRPAGAENKDKPLKRALHRHANNHPDELDRVAAKWFRQAMNGDVHAMVSLADRMDGKVPQAIVGDKDHPGLLGDPDVWFEWIVKMRSRMQTPQVGVTSPEHRSSHSTNGVNGSQKLLLIEDAAKPSPPSTSLFEED